jgi:hypothetical protein
MPTALRGHGLTVIPCPRKAVGMAPDTLVLQMKAGEHAEMNAAARDW